MYQDFLLFIKFETILVIKRLINRFKYQIKHASDASILLKLWGELEFFPYFSGDPPPAMYTLLKIDYSTIHNFFQQKLLVRAVFTKGAAINPSQFSILKPFRPELQPFSMVTPCTPYLCICLMTYQMRITSK